MDLSSPTLESVTSKVNPLQKRIDNNGASSICSLTQSNINSLSNTVKRARV